MRFVVLLVGGVAIVLAALWAFGWIGERWAQSRFADTFDGVDHYIPPPPIVAVLTCGVLVGCVYLARVL